MMTTKDTRPHTQALIQQAIDGGESSRSIAARAHQHGHKISHAYINNLQRGLITTAPDREMIAAIAAGLDLPIVVVRRAVFLDWFDYDTLEGDDFTALTVLPPDVTKAERSELEALVRAFLMTRRKT